MIPNAPSDPDHASIVGNDDGHRPHRLCLVGPMLGRNAGWVTTQGEILADQFTAEGWSVRETSPHPSRPIRLVDTLVCLLRWRRTVDIVILSVFSGPAFVMADITSLVARALGIPTVMWLHGGNLPEFEAAHPRWTRRVLGRAAQVVAPSSFLASLAPAAGRPIEVIPNLIEIDAVPFRARTTVVPRLLWMRTFHAAYNPTMAVRAMDRVRSDEPRATLTMAGQEKGLLADVRHEVHRLGLDDAVSMPGFLEPAEKAAAFDAHDIYLHTNHIDNTPVSVLEAAAAGLPVIATNVGGIPHLLEDEVSALLVPDDDDRAMASAIARLLTEPGLGERLSRNGRLVAEQSSWPIVRSRWQAVVAQVLGDGRNVT